MSGAGRRTIHRETGSGGWPNGLTVDYLEKRILWIDARSAPPPALGGLHPPPLQGQGGPGSQGLAVRRVVRRPGDLDPEPGGPGRGPAEGCSEGGAGLGDRCGEKRVPGRGLKHTLLSPQICALSWGSV